MTDTFIATGMGRVNGKLKLRWSNDPGFCLTQYKSRGEKDVIMIELSQPLTKVGCVRYMKQMVSEFHDQEHLQVIDQYLEKHL